MATINFSQPFNIDVDFDRVVGPLWITTDRDSFPSVPGHTVNFTSSALSVENNASGNELVFTGSFGNLNSDSPTGTVRGIQVLEGGVLQISVTDIRFDLDDVVDAFDNEYLGERTGISIDTLFDLPFVMNGSSGNDVLAASDRDDEVNGASGNDVLVGFSGDDDLNGGDGVDTVDYSEEDGSSGVDVDLGRSRATDTQGDRDTLDAIENVIGTRFDDAIVGDRFANVLNGGNGADTLNGGNGADTIIGGVGGDTLIGGGGGDTINGNGGGDAINAGGGRDTVNAGGGGDEVRGLGGADVINGGGGSDTLDGGGGGDEIAGAGGRDRIVGGKGSDDLSGGGGNDVFVFDIRNIGDDEISDFRVRRDDIELSVDIVANFDALEISDNAAGDAVIEYGRGTITLVDVAADDLTGGDFIFV